MKRHLVATAVCLTLAAGVVYAAKLNKEQRRLEECGVVMQEVLNIPDNIPHDLLEKAECVIVVPSVKKLAFGIGADYGRGAMVCRTGEHFRGHWGAPAMYALEGGSIGFQIGGEATDLILLVMNGRGMESILSSKVKLGADASVAGGPKDEMLPRIPTPGCALRSSAIRALAACLREFPSKAPRFVLTTTPAKTSMGARSRQRTSCVANT
jgi:lipid-binding SYLF domain-containing protein